jgi:hypothetical protein
MSAPHPFFDAIAYPWSRADAKALHYALYTRFRTSPAIDGLYLASGPNLPPLTLTLAPIPLWKEVLDNLVGARSLRALCDALVADASASAIHSAVQAVIDATTPLAQTMFSPGCIFVDRKPLRDHLAKLSSPMAAPTVLLVRGDTRCGNTWTERLVDAVARSYGGTPVYLYEGFVALLDDVVKSLFTAVGAPGYVMPTDSTEAALYKQICLDLWAAAQESGKVYWIIIDDLGTAEPRLDPAIRSFLDQFVLMMASPAMSQWFRLVLLNYPSGQVPTRWRDEVWLDDQPDIAGVDDAAITEFLQGAALESGKQMTVDEAQRVAAEVLQAVAATAEAGRLKAINAELKRRVEQF